MGIVLFSFNLIKTRLVKRCTIQPTVKEQLYMSQFNQIGFLFFDQILVSDPLYNHDFQITVSVMEILCL